MAVKIPFDSAMLPIMPTFVLATRSGEKLGTLPVSHLHFADEFASKSDLQFVVYKYNNDVELAIWDQIVDFKLVWCPEWDIWYEISVEINESNTILKNVSCSTLGVAELSQIMIYNTEINTEDDIARDDYVPTTLYNGFNPNASLLHRILEKAPHYTIEHVDSTIARIQRTFSFDNKSICDVFKEIAEEVGCLFVYNSGTKNGAIERSISVYDLESNCIECGFRGEFDDVCPNCGSTSIQAGYGEDTNILATIDNIASEIGYSSDTGSVKNCFRLVAGDDLMTATIANCNPNGSSYIWHITDETMSDMSDVLRAKIKAYNVLYEHFRNENEAVIDSGLLTSYNSLVAKYQTYRPELRPLPQSFVGYASLMDAYYDTIDFNLFLQSQLMPSPYIAETSAALEASKLTTTNLSPIGVTNIATCSNATATSAVLAIAKTLVDPRYQVKVTSSSYQNRVWSGVFNVVSYADETDTASTGTIYIVITGDYETYVRQRIEKLLNQGSDYVTDISDLFKLNNSNFAGAIRRYCLNSLVSFQSACQGCIDILVEQGIANDETWASEENNLYRNLYMPYYQKLQILEAEIALREYEISIIAGIRDVNDELIEDGVQTLIMYQVRQIQSALDFEKFLGETLWKEFAAYRREDTYQNDNFISDGLSTAELFENAREYINVASNELFKASTLQHSISSKLKNLLVIDSFKPIINNFKIGNWIRIGVDGKICKLRLIRYEIDFDNLSNIDVSFSDVKQVRNGLTDLQSILNNASSMSSSYEATIRQVTQNKKAKQIVNDWVNKGLDMTQAKIVSNATDQSITWDEHGILCRQYDSISDSYDDRQLKIINRGLYVTDNNWLTSKAGIGDFIFYNPETGQMEEAYGVIADTLVGNLILSQNVGIYNMDNSVVIDENGFVMTTNGENVPGDQKVFTIRKKNFDGTLSDLFYVDNDGNLVFAGTLHGASGDFTGAISATRLTIRDAGRDVEVSEYVDERITDITDEIQADLDDLIDTVDGSMTIWYTDDNTPPASPADKDIWYSRSTGYVKRYNADTATWDDISQTTTARLVKVADDAKSTADGKVTTFAQPTTPTAATVGDLWIDTDNNNKLHRWDGTEWVPLRDGAIEIAQLTASDALKISTGDTGINFKIGASQIAEVQIDKTHGVKITGAYNNYFQVTDSQMGFFASNGEPQLAFSNGDLAISGVLTALTGSNIAGWYTTSDAIYRGSSAFGASNGIYFGSSGLSLGDAFKVSVVNNVLSQFTLGSPTVYADSTVAYPLEVVKDNENGKYVLKLNNVQLDTNTIDSIISAVPQKTEIYRTTTVDSNNNPVFSSSAPNGSVGVLYSTSSSGSSTTAYPYYATFYDTYGYNPQHGWHVPNPAYFLGMDFSNGTVNTIARSSSNATESTYADCCRAGVGSSGYWGCAYARVKSCARGAIYANSNINVKFSYHRRIAGGAELNSRTKRNRVTVSVYDASSNLIASGTFQPKPGNYTDLEPEVVTLTSSSYIASNSILQVAIYSQLEKTLIHVHVNTICINDVDDSPSTIVPTESKGLYLKSSGSWQLMANGSSSGGGGGSSYSLPTASATDLGGIRVGSGLSIDSTGVLSISASWPIWNNNGTLALALKSGGGLTYDSNGLYVTGQNSGSISYTPSSFPGWSNATQKYYDVIQWNNGSSYTDGYFCTIDGGQVNASNIYSSTILIFHATIAETLTGSSFQFTLPDTASTFNTTLSPVGFCIVANSSSKHTHYINGYCTDMDLNGYVFTHDTTLTSYLTLKTISGNSTSIYIKEIFVFYC